MWGRKLNPSTNDILPLPTGEERGERVGSMYSENPVMCSV